MCEIQFCDGDFTVDKAYYKTILERQEMLAKEVSPKKRGKKHAHHYIPS